MKHLKIIFDFYRGEKAPTLLLILILTASLFLCSLAVAHDAFNAYSTELILNAGLESSVYFMSSGIIYEKEKMEDLIREVKQLGGVESVFIVKSGSISFNDISHDLLLLDDAFIKAFRLPLSAGAWDLLKQPGTENIPAILGGMYLWTKPLNSTVELEYVDNNYTTQSFKVTSVGNLRFPSYVPAFNISLYGSTDFLSQYFFRLKNVVILKDTSELEDRLQKIGLDFAMSSCGFVKFKDSATQSQKKEVADSLHNFGATVEFKYISESLSKNMAETRKQTLPLPIFLLFVSSVALISVSTMLVNKRLKTSSVYFLCGCSKRRSFGYTALSIALLSLAAWLINFIFILIYPLLLAGELVNLGNVIYDTSLLVYLTVYSALVIVISVTIPYLATRKMSSVDVLRRVR